METKEPFVLDMIQRPAFCVIDGKISKYNQAAAQYMLEVGTEVLPLLATGQEEYRNLNDGYLYLTLSIGGQKQEATVIATDDCHFFILEQNSALSELRALALAAQELRKHLTGLLIGAERAEMSEGTCFNHSFHKIMRVVSNMSDALYYCENPVGQMEYVELCAFLEEILEHAKNRLEESDLHLEYQLPGTAIYTTVDTEKLERCIYNLISNAAKHTPKGGSFRISLTQKNRLYLSVTDSGYGASRHPDFYTRYLRSPSITDGPDGIGLGMVLVRATAAMHGGVVVVDRPDGERTRVTMTLSPRHEKMAQLRSPLIYPDYAGERDHCLQELADVLPARLYAQK